MSFTYGFYDSINHDRTYNARQMSEIFDGIINDGVFESIGSKFMVSAVSGMQIKVGSGRAWFNHTWTNNDSDMPLTLDAAEPLYKRIDAIVLEVNENQDARENSIKIIKGTPATYPVKPALIDAEGIHQHPLAWITIKGGATSIAQADIENAVGTRAVPYVTAILEVTDVEQLLAQWDDDFHTWFQGIKSELDGDIVTNLINRIDGRVSKSGDTMTGQLKLPGNPLDPKDAVPKEYVDDSGVRNGTIITSAIDPGEGYRLADGSYLDESSPLYDVFRNNFNYSGVLINGEYDTLSTYKQIMDVWVVDDLMYVAVPYNGIFTVDSNYDTKKIYSFANQNYRLVYGDGRWVLWKPTASSTTSYWPVKISYDNMATWSNKNIQNSDIGTFSNAGFDLYYDETNGFWVAMLTQSQILISQDFDVWTRPTLDNYTNFNYIVNSGRHQSRTITNGIYFAPARTGSSSDYPVNGVVKVMISESSISTGYKGLDGLVSGDTIYGTYADDAGNWFMFGTNDRSDYSGLIYKSNDSGASWVKIDGPNPYSIYYAMTKANGVYYLFGYEYDQDNRSSIRKRDGSYTRFGYWTWDGVTQYGQFIPLLYDGLNIVGEGSTFPYDTGRGYQRKIVFFNNEIFIASSGRRVISTSGRVLSFPGGGWRSTPSSYSLAGRSYIGHTDKHYLFEDKIYVDSSSYDYALYATSFDFSKVVQISYARDDSIGDSGVIGAYDGTNFVLITSTKDASGTNGRYYLTATNDVEKGFDLKGSLQWVGNWRISTRPTLYVNGHYCHELTPYGSSQSQWWALLYATDLENGILNYVSDTAYGFNGLSRSSIRQSAIAFDNALLICSSGIIYYMIPPNFTTTYQLDPTNLQNIDSIYASKGRLFAATTDGYLYYTNSLSGEWTKIDHKFESLIADVSVIDSDIYVMLTDSIPSSSGYISAGYVIRSSGEILQVPIGSRRQSWVHWDYLNVYARYEEGSSGTSYGGIRFYPPKLPVLSSDLGDVYVREAN